MSSDMSAGIQSEGAMMTRAADPRPPEIPALIDACEALAEGCMKEFQALWEVLGPIRSDVPRNEPEKRPGPPFPEPVTHYGGRLHNIAMNMLDLQRRILTTRHELGL